MYKVVKAYSHAAEKKHQLHEFPESNLEQTVYTANLDRSAMQHVTSTSAGQRNGSAPMVPWSENRHHHQNGKYNKASSYETHEMYERKVTKMKQTKSEREKNGGRVKQVKQVGVWCCWAEVRM